HKERATFAADNREGILLEQFGTIAFSPDGKTLATAMNPAPATQVPRHHIFLWDVATGRKLFTLDGYTDYIGSVAFSPDGKILATGCKDLRSWTATPPRRAVAPIAPIA